MTKTSNLFLKACGELTARDLRNQWLVVRWLFLWQLAFVVASMAFKRTWIPEGAPAVALAVLPSLFGVAMLVAFTRFLRRAYELQRKIQLDALALGFGVGVVVAVGYELLEDAGVVFKADISGITVVMFVAYAVGVLLGARRYA